MANVFIDAMKTKSTRVIILFFPQKERITKQVRNDAEQ
jgi:hypothetical protein